MFLPLRSSGAFERDRLDSAVEIIATKGAGFLDDRSMEGGIPGLGTMSTLSVDKDRSRINR